MTRRRDPAARALRVKILLLTAGAGGAGCSPHLRPVYRITAWREERPRGATVSAGRGALARAGEIAEEILGSAGHALPPGETAFLTLRRADGEAATLTEALLERTEGIQTAAEVRVNGIRLGNVEDGEALERALQRSIRGQMPLKAVSGGISGRLELRPVYTRVGSCTPYSDMVLLITGVAPVIYLDPEGKLA